MTCTREDARSTRLPFGIENNLTTGQILIAAVVIISTATLYMGRVDTNQSDTKTLKNDMAAMKGELVQRMDQIRSDISNIPSMTERVSQLEKRVDRGERVLEVVQQSGIETATTLKNLLQQNAAAQRIQR